MTKREKLQEKIQLNDLKIQQLIEKNNLLKIECLKTSDKNRWYSEAKETVLRRKDGKKVYEQVLIGKVHWRERFTDQEGEGEITIDRQMVVRRDDVWYL